MFTASQPINMSVNPIFSKAHISPSMLWLSFALRARSLDIMGWFSHGFPFRDNDIDGLM